MQKAVRPRPVGGLLTIISPDKKRQQVVPVVQASPAIELLSSSSSSSDDEPVIIDKPTAKRSASLRAMMESSSAPSRLLDDLEPMAVGLRHSFWPHLDLDSQMHFRLTSRRARLLAEQLARRVTLNFADSRPGATGTPASRVGMLGACLGRHEHVEVLRLRVRGEEEGLMVDTLRLGGAACRRVVEAQLQDCSHLTAAASGAIVQACPTLRTLSLAGGGSMAASFFTPLQDLPTLSTVTLGRATFKTMEGMAALRGLTCFECAGNESFSGPNAFACVTTLISLRSLRLGSALLYNAPILRSLQSVSTLTHLTHLGLSSKYCTSPPSHKAPPPEDDAVAALMAQVCTLPHLVSLHVGRLAACVLDDAAFAYLCRVPQLTSLHVPRLALHHPPPRGAPLHLRELHLHHVPDTSTLLDQLQLLLHPQHLTDVTVCVALTDVPGALAAQLPPLRQMAEWLAECPKLRRLHLTLDGGQSPGDTAVPLPAWHAPPLAVSGEVRPRLEVRLCNASQLRGLAGVLDPFGALVDLRLVECHKLGCEFNPQLLQVAEECTALRRLEVWGCKEARVLEFLNARSAPLHVAWDLGAERVEHFRTLLKKLGKSQIVLVDCTS